MKRLLLLLMICLPFVSFAQQHIGKTKAIVKKSLQLEAKKVPGALLSDSGTVLSYSLKQGTSSTVNFIYRFNKAEICISEQVTGQCDSCFKNQLNKVLADTKYGWKKINENQYASKFSEKMVIELPGNTEDNSYMILRTDWDEAMYKLLTGE